MSAPGRPLAGAVLCALAWSGPSSGASEPPGWPTARAVLERHCGGCHRAGGIAPFSLETWEQARAWARSIRRAVAERTMPPWHADPRHGAFANDRSLPADAHATLLAWLDAGAPRGTRAEPSGPPEMRDRPPAGAGWSLGAPDAVLELPEVEVPAAGELPYHDYRLPAPFDREVWLRGVEVLPGNPGAVHHVIVEAFDPRAALRPGADPRTAGSLGDYVPGDPSRLLGEGFARRLPAGAEIVLQIHYAPTGEPQVDRTRVGLHLAEGPPRYEVRSGIASNPFLWIPAGAVGVERTAGHTFERAVRLLSLRPHLHRRGRSFEVAARGPGEAEIVLLRIPRWDFDWQTTYVLAEPVALPAGSELVARATWDNSAANPDNPDPTRDVSWGEQTADEMMILFFDYLVEPEPGAGAPSDAER